LPQAALYRVRPLAGRRLPGRPDARRRLGVRRALRRRLCGDPRCGRSPRRHGTSPLAAASPGLVTGRPGGVRPTAGIGPAGRPPPGMEAPPELAGRPRSGRLARPRRPGPAPGRRAAGLPAPLGRGPGTAEQIWPRPVGEGGNRGERRMTRFRPRPTLTLALHALLTIAPPALAQYTWSNPAGGNWPAGSNWQDGAPPAPGSTTALTFGAAATQAATYTATNDIGATGNAFDLNALTINNGTGTVTVAGNPLNFTGTNPAVAVAGAGNMVLSSPATLTATTTVAGTGAGGFTFGGALTGGTNNLVMTA